MHGVCAVSSDEGPCACHASRTLRRGWARQQQWRRASTDIPLRRGGPAPFSLRSIFERGAAGLLVRGITAKPASHQTRTTQPPQAGARSPETFKRLCPSQNKPHSPSLDLPIFIYSDPKATHGTPGRGIASGRSTPWRCLSSSGGLFRRIVLRARSSCS